MKVPELQNFLEARDMHSKSCGWKGKEKGRTTMKLCKNAAEMTSFRRTLFSIFNLATFLTSSSISSWSMSVWQEAETDFFYRVYLFFQLAKNWLCCPYTEKYSRDPSKRHQTTHGEFFAGNFRPLSPLFSFRYYSSRSLGPLVGWISLETPRLLPFLSFTRSSRCLWCRNAENICAGRGRLKLLVSSPAKGAPFLSKLFLTRKLEKVEVWSRFGIVFLHGNGTIPQIYLFCFQTKRLCCVFIPLSLVLML